MAIDLFDEELLTLAEACRLLPKTPAPATLWRWRVKGVKVNGQTIRLECVRVGGTWMTSRAAFADFLRETTRLAQKVSEDADELPHRTPSTTRRLREVKLI